MKLGFRYIILFLLCSLNSVLGQHSLDGQTVLCLETSLSNPRNSEGSFVSLKDGRILFIYSRFESSSNDNAPARLMARYSNDEGGTWTSTDTPIVDNEGDMNVMSVSLLRLQNGDIALFYLRKNSMDDCIPQMRVSKDEGKSWSAPRPVISDQAGYFVLNNDRVIQLKGGRILVPVSLHKTVSSSYSYKGELRCYYSDNNGISWNRGEEVPSPDTVITQEPGVVELRDGRVMMMIRASGGKQYISFSSDKGITWNYATPSGIDSPISPASVKRIARNGDLILVWNNNGETGPGYYKAKRTPLTVAISSDDGETWSRAINIENNRQETYAYTAILIHNEHILFSYYVKPDQEPGYYLKIKKFFIRDFY